MTLPAAEPSEARKSILVVDDEILIRMVIADYLRDVGYHVIEAGSADEALEYLRTPNQVRLVFSDVRMPGSMDGLELAQQVRLLSPHVPVILASGHLPPGAAGEEMLFSKPYSLAEVTAKIDAVVGEADGALACNVNEEKPRNSRG